MVTTCSSFGLGSAFPLLLSLFARHPNFEQKTFCTLGAITMLRSPMTLVAYEIVCHRTYEYEYECGGGKVWGEFLRPYASTTNARISDSQAQTSTSSA
ncbi:unnamed protein product [Hermetia illucens]|uniref:Uncharacterized protein n=1 Tax=Hermetia illucens TaxID=343691 RepID=A0A7R8YR88_HERIL|nr:unnamed protein product [Hermetia illucens]